MEIQQIYTHRPLSTRHNTQIQARQKLHPLVPDTVYLIQFKSAVHIK